MYRCKETKQELQVELSRLRKRWIASDKTSRLMADEIARLLKERTELKVKLMYKDLAIFLLIFSFFAMGLINIIIQITR